MRNKLKCVRIHVNTYVYIGSTAYFAVLRTHTKANKGRTKNKQSPVATGYFRREKRMNKIPKILTLSIFSHGDISMLTLPISLTGISNPLFGTRILSSTLAIGAVKKRSYSLLMRSSISPSQNNIGFDTSQIWVYPQSLLRISAGLMIPGM